LYPAVRVIQIDQFSGNAIVVAFPDIGIAGIRFNQQNAFALFLQVVNGCHRHHAFANAAFATADQIDFLAMIDFPLN
jgi:hypothetical protein